MWHGLEVADQLHPGFMADAIMNYTWFCHVEELYEPFEKTYIDIKF